MAALRFVELSGCDVLRDGGSYAAELLTAEGAVFRLGLAIAADGDGPRAHATLHEAHVSGDPATYPPALPPGSPREAEILAALDAFLDAAPAGEACERLRSMRAAIPRRSGVPRAPWPRPPLVLVATLTIIPGRRDAFEAYERQAAAIMARHGGAIERAVRIPGDPEREVHVVHFPDAGAFAAYRADPALAALATLRASVIAATEVLVGAPGPRYA